MRRPLGEYMMILSSAMKTHQASTSGIASAISSLTHHGQGRRERERRMGNDLRDELLDGAVATAGFGEHAGEAQGQADERGDADEDEGYECHHIHHRMC